MKPSGHTNYYGLVFGGSGLEGADQSYLYFVVAQNGTWLIKRRERRATRTVAPKTPNDVVKKPDDNGKSHQRSRSARRRRQNRLRGERHGGAHGGEERARWRRPTASTASASTIFSKFKWTGLRYRSSRPQMFLAGSAHHQRFERGYSSVGGFRPADANRSAVFLLMRAPRRHEL